MVTEQSSDKNPGHLVPESALLTIHCVSSQMMARNFYNIFEDRVKKKNHTNKLELNI